MIQRVKKIGSYVARLLANRVSDILFMGPGRWSGVDNKGKTQADTHNLSRSASVTQPEMKPAAQK